MKELVEFSCIFSSFFNIVDPIFLNIASVEDWCFAQVEVMCGK